MKLPLKKTIRSGRTMRGELEPPAARPCDAVWDLLSLYADQEASRDEAAMVESHIAVCVYCARDLEFMRSTHATFSTVREIAPPAGLRMAILAATVDRPGMGRRTSDLIHRLLAPAPARYGFAVAAGLAGVLVAVGIHRGMTPLGDVLPNPAAYQPGPKIAAIAPAAPLHSLEARPLDQERGPAAPRSNRQPIIARLSGGSTRVLLPAGEIASPLRRPTKSLLTAVLTPPKSAASKVATVPVPQPMKVAGGEMKLKSPVAESKPNSTDDSSLQTADMMVATDSAPTKPASEPTNVPAARDTELVATPAGSPRLSHILLTSASTADTVGQIASFADLKRSLKNSDLDGARAIEQSIKAGQIRLPVLRKSF